MRLKSKAGAFLAAVLVVVAVSAVPASAAGLPALPGGASLSGICNSIKDPAAKATCTQAISAVSKCSSAKGNSALIACLLGSVKGITGSGGIKGLVGTLGGRKVGAINLGGLLGQLGGGKLGGINIGSLLGQLGGGKLGGGSLGGLNISKLLSGLKL